MSNEKTIQNALYLWRDHSFIAPNFQTASGEMDLISVTKNGFVYEHEIKISRADFKADFKNKTDKHIWLREAKKLNGECEILRRKFRRYNISRIVLCANYFVYVVPENLIAVEEVPVYAGLYYWRTCRHRAVGTIEVIKKPPRLHSEKVTKERMEKLAISMMYRYWNYRLKEKAEIL